MMLDPGRLANPFPTDRLRSNGVARPEVRDDLARIPNLRNACSVVIVWGWAALLLSVPGVTGWWFAWPVAFVLMTPVFARFAILMHEAAHRLLFSDRRTNDLVGTWLIAYPVFVPMGLYRSSHLAHHRREFGPDEPDLAFYSGYPCEPRDLLRRLRRDAVGISGYKNLRPLVRGAVRGPRRRLAWSILGVQAVLWVAMWTSTGRWYVYPVLWLAPWMTGWRVANRLRSIGEHGGLGASDDRRLTTHNVRQSLLARFWFAPYHTGYHLAHHVDMTMPWRSLPRYHAELERAGYISADMTYPSYLALWRALCSRGDRLPARSAA